MDAIQMLRDDHRKVNDLFRQFEETSGAQAKKAVFDTIYLELEVHAALEEEIFYPSVRRQGERELIDQSEEEHEVVKQLLDEIVDMDPSDPRFEAKFHVLKDNVLDHVAEEESEMLPKAAEAGMSRMIELGERMQQRKQELMKGTDGQRRRSTRRRTTTTRRRTTTSSRTASGRTAARKTTSRAKASSGARKSNGSKPSTTRRKTTTSRSRATAGGSRSTARGRATARGGSTRSKTGSRRSGSRSGSGS